MPVTKLLRSLPQSAYDATQVLTHEKVVAKAQEIEMYRLMEKAGQAVFLHIQEHYQDVTNMLVLAGKGNNGGDGFVVARLAYEAGLKVTVYLCTEPELLQGDALTAFLALQKYNVTFIYQSELQLTQRFFNDNHYDIIVDAIFGIGYHGKLATDVEALIEVINQTKILTVSVDVPSGLNATTGHVQSQAIRAHDTVTFIVAKQGLLTGQAAHFIGDLYLATLSLNEAFHQHCQSTISVQGEHAVPQKPERSHVSHKGNIGLLLTVGGNRGLPGAIRLASEAALRSGAALVAVCCRNDNHQLVLSGRPELMLAPDSADKLSDSPFFEKAKVRLLGPGLGQTKWSVGLFNLCLAHHQQLVLDADALQLLAKFPSQRDNWVLTPHPGEAAKLLGCSIVDVEQDRFSAANAIVERYGGICVLKGAGTLVCDGQHTWINTSGNSGMASGGMGDVLSGIIAALLMQLDSPIEAVRLAVYLHGKAADIVAKQQGKIGMLASDLFSPIQQLLNK